MSGLVQSNSLSENHWFRLPAKSFEYSLACLITGSHAAFTQLRNTTKDTKSTKFHIASTQFEIVVYFFVLFVFFVVSPSCSDLNRAKNGSRIVSELIQWTNMNSLELSST